MEDEYEYSVRFDYLGVKGYISEGDWMSVEEAEDWMMWVLNNRKHHETVPKSNCVLVKRRKAGPVEEV